MEIKLEFAAILILILPILANTQTTASQSTSKPAQPAPAQQTAVQGNVVYDITKRGAKPDADISKIVTDIWTEVVASDKPSRIVIPKGTWKCSQLVLMGQNKAPIELEIAGTLLAGSSLNARPDPKREWITINYVTNLTIFGGGVLDGQGQEAWNQNDCHKNKNCVKLPYNLSFNSLNNTIVRDITTKDSKNFHANVHGCHHMLFQRYRVSAPGESPNTDGLHISRCSNITVIDSVIETGDDCISMGDKLFDVYISNITCGPGHGISIGSLGRNIEEKDVANITIRNCTFIGTSNGVRIKTWPSAPAELTISGLYFEDLIMRNASNPVVIDQQYCPYNLCKLDSPSLIKIKDVTVKNVVGTTDSSDPIQFLCSGSKPCENVVIGDVDLKYTGKPVAPPVSTKSVGGGLSLNSLDSIGTNAVPAAATSSFTSKCSNIKPIITGKNNVPICS